MAEKSEVISLRLKGLSYKAIGDIVGLSGERVRQILDDENFYLYSSARRRQAEAKRQMILDLHHQGMTQKKIAAELGIKSYTAVGQVIRDAGLSRYKDQRERDGINDRKIARLKEQGLTYKEIAERMNIRSISAVYKALKRQGVVKPLSPRQLELRKKKS